MRKISIILLALSIFFSLGIRFAVSREKPVREWLKEAGDLFRQGSFDESEKTCLTVIEKAPQLFAAYNILGSIYINKKSPEKVLEYFKKSLELNPMQLALYNNLSALYNQLKQPDKAMEYLEKGLSYYPDDFQMNFNLGLMSIIYKKDPYKASGLFMSALKQKPDYGRLLYLLGITSLLINKSELALEYITRLRDNKKEDLAVMLEDALRDYREKKFVDMNKVIKNYIEQPKLKPRQEYVQPLVSAIGPGIKGGVSIVPSEKQPKPVLGQSQGETNIQGGKTTVGGRGTLKLKIHFQPKPSN